MNAASLRISYLFESSEMAGGHRVALAQADALIARGHRVRIVTKGGPLTWGRSNATWTHVATLEEYDAGGDDFVVGTFYKTLPAAHAIAPGRAVHLCQGYEALIPHYAEELAAIERAYSLPLPKLVVSPHLVPICARFNDRVECVGQIVDRVFYRDLPAREHDPLRLLLVGEMQAGFRGVADAYAAIRAARAAGARFDLVRVSSLGPADGEPLHESSEFHTAVTNDAMTGIVHSCDIAIAPNHAVEGFGLPAAEAMASGLPLVATRIPAYLSFDGHDDFALFADPGNPESLTAALSRMLGDGELRQRLRLRGRRVAESFDAAPVAMRIERFLLSL
ncbi:MAG: glycosyltransferase family 4 protein [Acidobacteria bacterium]|nr:glycosyltransferase family 4 protein [Acidobacteriota bacterium]